MELKAEVNGQLYDNKFLIGHGGRPMVHRFSSRFISISKIGATIAQNPRRSPLSQSVPLLAILASYLTLTCLSLIKSTLFPNLVIFTSETSVEFVIFFLFLQPQLLQIHLSPANLTTAIHFTLASHNQISTNFNAFKTHWHASLQTLQNINTSHQH